MSRWTFILNTAKRALVQQWIARAPDGFTVEIREPKRSDAQNRALWPLLTEIAAKRPKHCGVAMDPDSYKAVFMHAVGQEIRFLPSLDGNGMVPYGHRSSQLSKSEFSDLLEYIHAWCAREQVEISQHMTDDESAAA